MRNLRCTPKASVILPVYNAKPWLRDCLDSIRAQTFANWECICVDDGSTDDSSAILGEFATKDSRFRVFRRERSNAGAARNFGMSMAKGAYLTFLDSDDAFSPWMLETLVGRAEVTDADVVACSSIWFLDGSPVPGFSAPKNVVWVDRTPDRDLSRQPMSIGSMPWNKIIRKSFVDDLGLRFLEQPSTNDATFMQLALLLSRKTEHTDVPFIAYRQRSGSIQALKSKNPFDFFQAMDAIVHSLRERGAWEDLSAEGRFQWIRFYAKSAVWQLSTQTTVQGYRRILRGIRETENRARFLDEMAPERVRETYELRRFRSIVRGGPKEVFQSILEATLAPLVGNRTRLTGWRARLGKRAFRLCRSVFISRKLLWIRE